MSIVHLFDSSRREEAEEVEEKNTINDTKQKQIQNVKWYRQYCTEYSINE